jgi:hypothetical protein
MRFFISALPIVAILVLTGCSNTAAVDPNKSEVRTVPAGEKAAVGHLTYAIVDSQIVPQLGDISSPRVPKERFILLQIAVTNSSNVDNPIPAVELVGDDGQSYTELSDGSGVTNWLGVVRHVEAGQTERGEIAFDAPAAHYKVRFTDESMNNEIMADLPLSYAHDSLDDALVPTSSTDLGDAASGGTGPKVLKTK